MEDLIERQISDVHLSNNKGDMSDDDDDDNGDVQRKFNEMIVKGKKLVSEGKIAEALEMNKKALQLCYSEKLARKIKKMEDYLAAHGDESDDEDDGMLHLGKGFYIFRDLYKSLYAHQQEGVLWLWSLFRRKKGGILGDDMGLGKTIQVIGFLSGMFDMQKIRSVLIVLPVAVMVNWENEFQKWAPGLKVVAYHGNSKVEKRRALARVQKRGGVCLTTYGLVVTSWEQLGTQDGREFVWDYMILDEGHKIKNPTKTSKGVHAIPARNRIILTGTPVQNNLKELWSLFDFVHQGTLLGNQKTFKMAYENPITRAREKDATVGEKKLGIEMAESLKKIIAPFFLRRTKAEVNEKEKEDKDETDSKDLHAVMPTMTRKNDLIVWTYLRDTQLKIYQDFLSLDSVKELLMTSKSPLVALTVLKKICDHPRLLSTRACSQLGIQHDDGLDEDMLDTEEGNLPAVSRLQHISDDVLINESGKLHFLVNLLDRLKEEGHRCLVFSQSRKMLDIMQKIITGRGHKVMRLDGTIAQVQEREQRIKKFQTDSRYSVFLLTTQVGGVGLTLTAADRVVIFDPSWNPAVDAQAVDRAFRIGQEKNVVVYRLITCGTVEEKIYRRQIFKDSITRQTTGNAKNPHRYFSKYELRELFVLDEPRSSSTQQQLEQMHSGQRLTDPSLDDHIAYLYSLEMFGLSDHDLMFSHGNEAGDEQDDADEGQVDPENDYIQHQVQKAREIIQMESSQPSSLDERLGKNSQVGSSAGRNLYNNWDFPKPEIPCENNDEVKASDESEDTDLDVSVKLEPTNTHLEDVKQEYDYIDLTSPVVKKEPEEHRSIYETPTKIKKEPGLTTSGSPYIQQMDVDSPRRKVEPDIYHDHNSMELGTPDRNSFISNAGPADVASSSPYGDNKTATPNTSSRRSLLYTPKSNKKDKSIVNEEILISPDSSRPLVQTRPPSASSLSSFSIPSAGDFRPKFNSTVLRASDNHNELISNGTSPALSERSFFQDSPMEKPENNRHPFKVIVEDSPLMDNKRKEERNGDVSIVEESVIIDDSVVISSDEEKENMEPGGIMVHDLQNILERSLNHNASVNEANVSHSDSPITKTPRRKSSAYRKPVIESSDDQDDEAMNETSEENEVMNHTDVVDNSVHEAIEIEADDDELPDLDDEEESSRECSKTNADATVDEVDDSDKETSHMEHSDEIEESEEEYSEDDEEEEPQGFEALPEDEQIRYNKLVEKGRALCAAKQYEEGQVCVLQALEIYPDPELQGTCMAIQRKIMKLQMKSKLENERQMNA